jgi:hypothetical protein
MHPLASLILSLTILAFLMKRMSYGYALIVSTSIFIATFSILEIPLIFLKTVTSWETIELALMIIFVNVLAHVMKGLGEIEDFVEEIVKFVSPKRTLIILPAFLGLLPIPGGAVMSAPLIESSAKNLKLKKHVLAFSNIWFRHIVMPIYPLTPSIIVIANITGMNIYNFIAHMIPFFVIMTLIGYFFLRGVSGEFSRSGGDIKKILRSILPIILPVIANAVGVPLLLSILLGVLTAFLIKPVNMERAMKLVKNGMSPSLFFAIVGIMYFKYAIDNSTLIPFIEEIVESAGIPLWVLSMIVSALIGVLFGAMMAGVAISVSLLYPFIDTNMMYLSLIFVSSLLTYILSPMHLCNILTFEYFRNDIGKFYKYMIPTSAITLLISIPLVLIYGKIGWV